MKIFDKLFKKESPDRLEHASDALDHIRRSVVGSRSQTRRLR